MSADLDEVTLSRRRSGTINEYELQGEEYRSFGASVPEPVAALTNVDEVNFAGQHDAPFWFGLTPGQVSQELNRIVDLELIDRSLSAAASEVRDARQELDSARSAREAASTRLRGLSWVDGADAALKEIAAARADSARFQGEAESLRAIQASIRETRRRLQGVERVEEAARRYLAAADRQEAARQEEDSLRSLRDEVRRVKTELERVEEEEREQTCPTCGRPL